MYSKGSFSTTSFVCSKGVFFDHSKTLPEGIDWVNFTRGCPGKQKHVCALYVYSLNYTCKHGTINVNFLNILKEVYTYIDKLNLLA